MERQRALRRSELHPARAAPEHVHRAGLADAADGLARRRYDEVRVAVVVDVARGERVPELIVRRGVMREPDLVQVDVLVTGVAQTVRAAVEDVHLARARLTGNRRAVFADREIVVTVAVEVAGRPVVPEATAGRDATGDRRIGVRQVLHTRVAGEGRPVHDL